MVYTFTKFKKLDLLIWEFWIHTLSHQISLEIKILKIIMILRSNIALVWQENKSQEIRAVGDQLQRYYWCLDSYVFIHGYD